MSSLREMKREARNKAEEILFDFQHDPSAAITTAAMAFMYVYRELVPAEAYTLGNVTEVILPLLKEKK